MKQWLLGGGMALCLFSLWAIGRHDWLRLTRPTRRAIAEVTGHRTGWSDGRRTYAALYRFTAEDGVHEVTDPVFTSSPRPPVGTMRELAYPEGYPELARPPRLLMWAAVYLLLIGLLGILLARATGWLPHP